MNQGNAQRIVIGVIAMSFILIGYDMAKRRLRGEEAFRAIWAVGLLFLVLSFLADIIPKIAAPFALLILVSLLGAREQVLGNLVGITGYYDPSVGITNAPVGGQYPTSSTGGSQTQ